MFDKSCLKTHCARDPSEMECGNEMERWPEVEMRSCWAGGKESMKEDTC